MGRLFTRAFMVEAEMDTGTHSCLGEGGCQMNATNFSQSAYPIFVSTSTTNRAVTLVEVLVATAIFAMLGGRGALSGMWGGASCVARFVSIRRRDLRRAAGGWVWRAGL